MPESAPALVVITPRGKLVFLAVVTALFAVMGIVVVVLAPTKTLNLIVGVAAIGFFGVGGGYAITKQWRRSLVLRADDTGIRVGHGPLVPWSDIDRVGSNSAVFGIRLRRYDSLHSAGHAGVPSAAEMRANRKQPGGWDLVWPARVLDRFPGDAARDVLRRRPAS
ncbi:MAG TPA: hypothetical protein VJR25_14265 [Microbacterium sp.]|uniref:hypothetical protein n=1 Tax=Microbacterium sp. TaxID=51671 RepID=UPI002B46730A|nr:hypothetical protein [Microbacterium sp.]HKT57925.1 hypothetical protein [Microbacterium sp.]